MIASSALCSFRRPGRICKDDPLQRMVFAALQVALLASLDLWVLVFISNQLPMLREMLR